jgi:hypothetical protein
MSITDLLEKVSSTDFDRRKFFKRAGTAGIGIAATTMLGGAIEKLSATTTLTDADIINFALNLEYLEAEFYSVATYGATLEHRGIILSSAVSGPTTGGKMVNFSGSKIAFLASALRVDEQEHVLFLRKALGSSAVKKPAINLDALGFGFGNVSEFLKLSRIFEDVGVSAYLGAAPLIQSKTYLDAAARILATEAQHAGAIRIEVITWGVPNVKVDAKDVPPTQQNPFDVDSNALSIPRSTSEVLHIVYGGGAHSGGFYPDGMNGTIK